MSVANQVKTARDMFYFVDDVMALLGFEKSKAYKIIAELNKELEESGILVCQGRVSKRYFNQRFGLDDIPLPKPKAKTA